jgi:hypothetical protein
MSWLPDVPEGGDEALRWIARACRERLESGEEAEDCNSLSLLYFGACSDASFDEFAEQPWYALWAAFALRRYKAPDDASRAAARAVLERLADANPDLRRGLETVARTP